MLKTLADGLQEGSPRSYTYNSIGANLQVDPSTVYRTVQLFLNTGTVDKKYNPDNLPCKLNDVIQLLILQLVLDRPGIILALAPCSLLGGQTGPSGGHCQCAYITGSPGPTHTNFQSGATCRSIATEFRGRPFFSELKLASQTLETHACG